MVLRDGLCDGLEQHRLAGPGRRDYHAPLPLAYRGDQLHDARVHVAPDLDRYLFVWVERGKVVEEYLVPYLLGRLEVDVLDLEQGEVALTLLRGAYLAGDGVARPQVEPPYLGGGYVYVVRAGQVVVVRGPQEPEPVGQRL